MTVSSALSEHAPPRRISKVMRGVGLGAGALAAVAQLSRALVILNGRAPWIWYVILGAAYLALYALSIWRPPQQAWARHGVLVAESAIVLVLLLLEPDLDFLSGLLAPLAFQAAAFFPFPVMWRWIAALAALTLAPLVIHFGPLHGLSLGLISVSIEIVLAAYVVVLSQIERARRESQIMLQELEASHDQLREYASRAGELATLGQREQVARELNYSVAQTLAGICAESQSIRQSLSQGDAGKGVEAAPAAADQAGRLAALQTQTQAALAQMRRLIAELRPAGE